MILIELKHLKQRTITTVEYHNKNKVIKNEKSK